MENETSVLETQGTLEIPFYSAPPRVRGQIRRTTMYTDASKEDLLHVQVLDRSHLEDQLDKAVDILAARSPLHGGKGILVSRNSPRDFTVQLHPDVPFGTIQERQEW
ncbi:hypothetical protein [Arthrobacter sp. efr-133-TYG-104]|uniref:hypothetical protein n=1 Tax=Arthrobacter sp. efr-133-TYG-104 TaxID=3040324 RepID=UPI00254ADC42|nr:hypothetical protein [Arthrobacter sp. efr-133-TYG-104]